MNASITEWLVKSRACMKDGMLALQLDAVQYGRGIFMGDACRIARLLGTRKCSEVHAVLRELPASPESAPSSPPLGPARRMGSKRKPAAPPTRRKNSLQVLVHDDSTDQSP